MSLSKSGISCNPKSQPQRRIRQGLLISSSVLILGLAACLGLSDSDRRYNSSVKLLEEGFYQEAIIEFDLVIFATVSYAPAYHNRALAEGRIGSLASTLKDYSKAIELDLSYAKAHLIRALAHAKLGMAAQYLANLNHAVSLGMDRAAAELNIGSIASSH